MRRLLSLATALCWFVANNAAHANSTGDEMLPGCKAFVEQRPQRSELIGAVKCGAQFSTIRQLAPHLTDKLRVCIPDSVTAGQVGRVVVKYLENNPGKLHQDFTILSLIALRTEWPCK